MFDSNGMVVKRQRVYVVTGSYGSGKTTYVRRNMKRGDLVVDLDMLYMAVSMQPMHDTPDELLRVVWEVRDFLYGLITQRKGEWATAWVIAALPKTKQRELLVNELSAELIEINTDEAACIRNIMADDSRLDKAKHVEFVKNYWRQFEKS